MVPKGRAVALFLGKFTNRIDSKGRVSVPAAYREALAGESFKGIIALRSLNDEAIVASGVAWIEDLARRRDYFDLGSEEHDAYTALFNDAQQLSFDSEGRVILPEEFLAHARIGDGAVFAGNADCFEIWEPMRFAAREEARRGRARGVTLPSLRKLGMNVKEPR
jgi:MraZ protein